MGLIGRGRGLFPECLAAGARAMTIP